MAHLLSYKGYEGTIEFDPEAEVLRGKILYIPDLITFQSADCKKIEEEFRLAVDDYLSFCEEIGKIPAKPLSGQFNVRISPALHRAAASRAIIDDISLNAVVSAALETYVSTSSEEIKAASKINQIIHSQTFLAWHRASMNRKMDADAPWHSQPEPSRSAKKRENIWH